MCEIVIFKFELIMSQKLFLLIELLTREMQLINLKNQQFFFLFYFLQLLNLQP
jgi:hypothetical protein